MIGGNTGSSAENTNHRFNSFADQRSNNFVKWHIDGHDYLYAVSEMLDSAKESIFILDWWLTPELYLRRPPAYHPEWRLDRLLQRKAEQGVKIYVAVYKEVVITGMSMNSEHTQSALEALHPNIACMRHPDHFGARDDVLLWSHHEKVVVVDNQRACIGGFDLCFGRWDTHTHPLADAHPTEFSWTLFPGQDYNNARVLDFKDVPNYVSNYVSIQEIGRMPWHDVHMTFAGPVVQDIVQHFTERWNFIKELKYKQEPRYAWLPPVHNIESSPKEAVSSGMWRQMGQEIKQLLLPGASNEPDPVNSSPFLGTCRVQAVRSASEWSHGVPTEHSIQNAYRQLILEAQHFIYIENQFFISTTTTQGPVKNLIAQALVQRIIQAATEGKKFKVIVVIPEVPGFAGNVKTDASLKTIMAGQYRTINRGGNSIYEDIRKAGFEPLDYIRFYHLRSYDRINAPNGFISKMEANSGVKFDEAQVALAREWIGDQANAGGKKPLKEVYVEIPLPTAEGITQTKADSTKTERFRLPATDAEAEQIIKRFEHGADTVRDDKAVADTVSQHRFADKTSLLDEKWLGTAQEEKDAYISELLYIHTKLMIVDDRKVILGSANINDRSMKGDGDSEFALVVEDDDYINSTMDGRPYQASRFATTLRRKLFREHLGLMPPQLCDQQNEPVTSFMRCAPYPNEDETRLLEDALVADPLADSFHQLWNDSARQNREIFTEIFRIVPTNLVRDWKAYNNYLPKVKTGHVVADVSLDRIKDRLSLVKGSLVECPLDFLIDQKDFTENLEWSGFSPTLAIYI